MALALDEVLLSRSVMLAIPQIFSPFFRRIASGGLWSLAGEVGSRGLSLAAAIIVARALGVAEYGAFALIQSTLATFMSFAVFGMGYTSSRYIALYRSTDPSRIEGINGVSLLFSAVAGFLASAAFFAAAPYIAVKLLRAPDLEGPLRMVAPVLLLYAISGSMGGVILGFEAFARQARVAWASSLGNFVSVVSGVLLWGLKGATIGLIVSELLRFVLVMMLAHRVMRENGLELFGRARISEASVLWQFSLPLFISSALNAPVMWLCQTMIARQTNGFHEVGLYDAAQKWMTIVMLVPIAASAAFGPVLANLSGRNDKSEFMNAISSLTVLQLLVTAIPAAIVAFLAPYALLIFGPSFAAASSVVVLMMVLAPIFVLKHLYWQVLTSGGRAWTSLMLSLLWALTAVGFTWVLRDGGATSLATAMLTAYFITLVASIVLVGRLWRH